MKGWYVKFTFDDNLTYLINIYCCLCASILSSYVVIGIFDTSILF